MPHLIDKYGFASSPIGEGVQGGVILLEYADTLPSLEVKYFYTDLNVLMAFECGIICRDHNAKREAVEKCCSSLLEGLGSEKVNVPKAAFLEAMNVNSLLALIGLHNEKSSYVSNDILRVVNHTRQFADRTVELSIPLGVAKNHALRELGKLTVDNDVCIQLKNQADNAAFGSML